MRIALLAAIAACTLFTSCKFPLKLTTIRIDTEPHVKLKNGKKIEGDPNYQDRVLAADRIKIADTTVRAKDVAFYSSNGINYANVSKRKTTFAEQVATGKINVYKYESTYTTIQPLLRAMEAVVALNKAYGKLLHTEELQHSCA